MAFLLMGVTLGDARAASLKVVTTPGIGQSGASTSLQHVLQKFEQREDVSTELSIKSPLSPYAKSANYDVVIGLSDSNLEALSGERKLARVQHRELEEIRGVFASSPVWVGLGWLWLRWPGVTTDIDLLDSSSVHVIAPAGRNLSYWFSAIDGAAIIQEGNVADGRKLIKFIANSEVGRRFLWEHYAIPVAGRGRTVRFHRVEVYDASAGGLQTPGNSSSEEMQCGCQGMGPMQTCDPDAAVNPEDSAVQDRAPSRLGGGWPDEGQEGNRSDDDGGCDCQDPKISVLTAGGMQLIESERMAAAIDDVRQTLPENSLIVVQTCDPD